MHLLRHVFSWFVLASLAAAIPRSGEAQTLRIGVLGDVTGVQANVWRPAIEEVTRTLAGSHTLHIMDSQSRVPDASERANILVFQNEVRILILATSTDAAFVAANVATQREVLVLSLAVLPQDALARLRQASQGRVFAVGDLPEAQARLAWSIASDLDRSGNATRLMAPPGVVTALRQRPGGLPGGVGLLNWEPRDLPNQLSPARNARALLLFTREPGEAGWLLGELAKANIQQPGTFMAVGPNATIRGRITGDLLRTALQRAGSNPSPNAIARELQGMRRVDAATGEIVIPWETAWLRLAQPDSAIAAAFQAVESNRQDTGNSTFQCCNCSGSSNHCCTCQNGQTCGNNGSSGEACRSVCN